MPEIIPAAMVATRDELTTELLRLGAFATSVHVDFMDGLFVPSQSWPFEHNDALGHIASSLVLEAHLMVRDQSIGVELPEAGFTRIIGHIEAFDTPAHARIMLQSWLDAGAREVGLSLLPSTPLEHIEPALELCSVIQVMGIEKIGFQGQEFVVSTYARVAEIKAAHPHISIEVDGGVSEATIPGLVRAGAQRLVVGSAISHSSDARATYQKMRDLAHAS